MRKKVTHNTALLVQPILCCLCQFVLILSSKLIQKRCKYINVGNFVQQLFYLKLLTHQKPSHSVSLVKNLLFFVYRFKNSLLMKYKLQNRFESFKSLSTKKKSQHFWNLQQIKTFSSISYQTFTTAVSLFMPLEAQ